MSKRVSFDRVVFAKNHSIAKHNAMSIKSANYNVKIVNSGETRRVNKKNLKVYNVKYLPKK